MKKKLLLILPLLFVAAIFCTEVKASHAQGADITYVNISPNTYVVTYNMYRDCSGISASNAGTLNYRAPGCNSGGTLPMTRSSVTMGNPYCAQVLPTCNSSSSLPNYETNTYSGTLILPQTCSNWLLYTRIGNRNDSRNLANGSSEYLYSEAMINNVATTSNSSPSFINLPVPYICKDQFYVARNYTFEQDGDSLQFVLMPALTDFNDPVSYAPGFLALNPFGANANPGLAVDISTGKLSVKPTVHDPAATHISGLNKYAVVVQVNEYRQVSGSWVKIGHVRRDMLVTVLDCGTNVPPFVSTLAYNGTQYNAASVIDVEAGQQSDIVFTTDDQNVADRLTISSNPSAVLNGTSFFIAGGSRPTGTIRVNPPLTAVRAQPYLIEVKIEDDACPLPGKTYETIAIRVNAPTTIGLNEQLAKKYNLQTLLTPNNYSNNRLVLAPELAGAAVSIYSPEGRLIKSYSRYDNSWSATDIAAGVYIYQVEHQQLKQVMSSRLMVVK
ncbi:MAG: T9SS type A sorting domain-containing protein [Hymenobacteraceae bacterium]|nr:T9SS type A sorting domain-containing protein [Hymenobacteraceae bacterium]